MIELFYREHGSPSSPPLCILHGLLGSSTNWTGVGRALADEFRVLTPDLRNHGQSPHAEEHTMEHMVADVLEFLDRRECPRVGLVGHSMGGKVAMRLACDHPERVDSLTVIDIAPKDYPVQSLELDAMVALDPASCASRADADKALARTIADGPTRVFLLTNLERQKDGGFRWRANVTTLRRGIENMRRTPLSSGQTYPGPSLFVLGGMSEFVAPSDEGRIREHFPCARLEVLATSGHNPHVDNRDALVELLRQAHA